MHSSRNHQPQSGRLHPKHIIKYAQLSRHNVRRGVQQTPSRANAPKAPSPASQSATPAIRPATIGRSVHAADTYSTILSLDDELLRQAALSEAKIGNYQDAIALFDELLEKNPYSATDYNNRGLVHFKCNHHTEALSDYNTAIALDDKLDSVYNNRANYYAHKGDLLGALLDYEMAIDLNPYNVRAWINQGITFRDLRMYSRAVECFDSALQFSALQEHIFLERGRTHHLRGDWNCAVADYQRVITYVVEVCDHLSDRELRLLTQAENWLDELLAPLSIL